MYWRPSSEVLVQINNPDGSTKVREYVKTNLSKKGKIYAQKPSWSWIQHGYYNHLLVKQMIVDQNRTRDSAYRLRHHVFPFIQSEWELEEIL
jgi:hypothetical protein